MLSSLARLFRKQRLTAQAVEFFAAINEGISVVEFAPDGTILAASAFFLQTTGFTAAEVVGNHRSMLIDAASRGGEQQDFWADLRRGETKVGDFKHLCKDGKPVWLAASYKPIRDRRGRVSKIVSLGIDTTDCQVELTGLRGQAAATSRSHAIIEFSPDGTILTANSNFLSALGYQLGEVIGRPHSMFVDAEYRVSADYKMFWDRLRAGEHQVGQFRRIAKNSCDIWIEASYTPVIDSNGSVYKIVKFATEITGRKLAEAETTAKLAAVSRSHATIEFDTDGTVLDANQNFLDTLGYTIEEIRGRHHRLFVDPVEASAPDYEAFWSKLRRGEYDTRVYRRVRKDGRSVWIQASYNPVFDQRGRVSKIVKFAQDVTEVMQTADIAEEAVKKVHAVAAATEEMAAAVYEISHNMLLSKQATEDIKIKTVVSGEAGRKLLDTIGAMGRVVGLISTIANQVKLLALNAAIEASRAGEAGRGFAVVASEVKQLANQTAAATTDISAEISSVEALCKEVSGSIDDIVTVSARVSEYVASVAAAVEEQTAVTNDIARNSQHALRAAGEIEQRVRALAQVA